MKKLIIVLAVIASSCCNKPAPNKMTFLDIVVKKDTLFIRNIQRIYAIGSNTNNSRFIQNPKQFEQIGKNSLYQLNLPISYAADSTAYIFEQKNKANDTIIVYYKRNTSYDDGGNCGYQETLSSKQKPNYSSLKKYDMQVAFGTFGTRIGIGTSTDAACEIKLYEK
jgi:hypothetical protein